MPKHKKTKKQKLQTDTRRVVSSSQTPIIASHSPVLTSQQPIPEKIAYSVPAVNAKTQTMNTLLYPPYVTSDVKRTAIITTGIFLALLILFYIMNNHMLALPNG